MQISSLYHFSASFEVSDQLFQGYASLVIYFFLESVIYIAFISTAVIDSGIAITMTLILFKTKSGTATH
jgi:hypothetical protein